MITKYCPRILVVTENTKLQDMLNDYMLKQHYDTEYLSSSEALSKAVIRQRFDLLILDCAESFDKGSYWLRWIKNMLPSLPVLILLSDYLDKGQRLSILEQGAKDYLLRPFYPQELFIRIEAILGLYSERQESRYLDLGEITVDTENCCIIKPQQEIKLTRFETKILQILYLNLGYSVSRQDIVAQVRGQSYNPTDRSIDIHINKIRKKLESNPTEPQYIRTIRCVGYCLNIPEKTEKFYTIPANHSMEEALVVS
ncbi:MAG: response regulator transcription factor [bacterium]